jgi:hypothetical protein
MSEGPGLDLFKDLAIVQPSGGAQIDPARAEASEALAFRRRIAAVSWLPGLAIVLTLAAWSGSAAFGVALLVLLLVGLFVYAERGDRLAARIRRHKD